MKQTNSNAQNHTNNSIDCQIVKLSNCQLSSIVFIDDDNAHIHLLGSGRQEALLSKTSIKKTVDVKTRGLAVKTSIRRTVDQRGMHQWQTRGLAVKTSIRRTVDSVGARSMGTSIGVVDQNKKNGASPDDHSSG